MQLRAEELKGLVEQRADLVQEMKDLTDAAEAEKRAFSEEEGQKFDELEKKVKDLDATIGRMERARALDLDGQRPSHVVPAGHLVDRADIVHPLDDLVRDGRWNYRAVIPERQVCIRPFVQRLAAQIGLEGPLLQPFLFLSLRQKVKDLDATIGRMERARALDLDASGSDGGDGAQGKEKEGLEVELAVVYQHLRHLGQHSRQEPFQLDALEAPAAGLQLPGPPSGS